MPVLGNLRQEDGKPGLPCEAVSTNRIVVMVTDETIGRHSGNQLVILISSCIKKQNLGGFIQHYLQRR